MYLGRQRFERMESSETGINYVRASVTSASACVYFDF